MLEEVTEIYRHTLQKHSWKGLQDHAGIQKDTPVNSIMFLVMSVKYRKTKNDPLFILNVIDPTLDPNDSYTCNLFAQDRAMPDPQEGDIMIFRNGFFCLFNQRPQLNKNKHTKFAFFNQQSEKRYQSENYYEQAGDQEVHAAFLNWVKARFDPVNGPRDKSHQIATKERQVITTDQILHDEATYFNYVGMIVGFFAQKEQPQRREIKVTDFTKNPHPLTRRDDIADDGNIGNITNDMALLCTLYNKHADCGPLSFGDYVLLENCTRNTSNTMQLEIRVGFREGDRLHVTRLDNDDPFLQPLLERKREYEASLDDNASQISETAVNLMRSRIPGQQTLVPIKQLLEKEEAGVEYIRVTIEMQKSRQLASWLKNYCSHCKKTYAPTGSKELDVCCNCGNTMKPVYRAIFKVRDESGSELAVLAMDEDADKLFRSFPADRLKKDPELWSEFQKYINYSQRNSSGHKPYFSLGVNKYYNVNNYYQDGWMYSIVNTEFILEDGNE